MSGVPKGPLPAEFDAVGAYMVLGFALVSAVLGGTGLLAAFGVILA